MMDAFELPRTLVQSLQRRAAQTPDQVALRFLAESAEQCVVLSYRDLDQRARTIAAALQASAGPGERAVLLRHGQAIELHQQPSGSGFVYSNGPNTIRGKGDELRVEIGRMVPMLCTARGAPR